MNWSFCETRALERPAFVRNRPSARLTAGAFCRAICLLSTAALSNSAAKVVPAKAINTATDSILVLNDMDESSWEWPATFAIVDVI